MPIATFRKVTITVTKKGWGAYLVEADYRGRHVKTTTHDSEMYDDLSHEDEYDMRDCYGCTLTQARELINKANRKAYRLIREAYERER